MNKKKIAVIVSTAFVVIIASVVLSTLIHNDVLYFDIRSGFHKTEVSQRPCFKYEGFCYYDDSNITFVDKLPENFKDVGYITNKGNHIDYNELGNLEGNIDGRVYANKNTIDYLYVASDVFTLNENGNIRYRLFVVADDSLYLNSSNNK